MNYTDGFNNHTTMSLTQIIKGSKVIGEFISIILSSVRFLATGGIFVFHVLGMANLNNNYLDFISILIFCFLSGFFGTKVNLHPHKWIIRRFFSIMIPYWLVIIPVLIINKIIHYKNTTIFMDIITIAGGNMFLNNPVYVIAWYITFVLILYFFIYLQSIVPLPKVVSWSIGYIIIGYILHKKFYFMSFALGFYLAKFIFDTYNVQQFKTKLGLFLFKLQKYCYPFFLVHGGILVFFNYELKLSLLNFIIWGFIVSSFFAFLLFNISNFLISKLTH